MSTDSPKIAITNEKHKRKPKNMVLKAKRPHAEDPQKKNKKKKNKNNTETLQKASCASKKKKQRKQQTQTQVEITAPPFLSTIAAAIGNQFIIKQEKLPYCNAYVNLTSWDDPTPTFGCWPCLGNPKGNEGFKIPADQDIQKVEAIPMFIDVRASERADWSNVDKNKEYPDTSICSDFSVHKRIFADFKDGKDREKPIMPGTLEQELMALLPPLKELPSCFISVEYRVEARRSKGASIGYHTFTLLSRFSTNENGIRRINHNVHLLD